MSTGCRRTYLTLDAGPKYYISLLISKNPSRVPDRDKGQALTNPFAFRNSGLLLEDLCNISLGPGGPKVFILLFLGLLY